MGRLLPPGVTETRPTLITAKEAAARLAISLRKLWSLTASGDLRCVRMGRAVRYDLRDLEAFIEKNKKGT